MPKNIHIKMSKLRIVYNYIYQNTQHTGDDLKVQTCRKFGQVLHDVIAQIFVIDPF